MRLSKILALFFLISFIFPIEVTNDITRKADLLLLQGMENMHNANYKKAFKIFNQVIELMPDHPAGYLFYGAGIKVFMFDYHNFRYENEFIQNILKSLNLAEKMIKKDDKNPWGYFYLGGAYGFRGLYKTEYGGFLSAVSDGLNGYRKMKKALELDPSIYDAYYGTALFYYWKSVYAIRYRVSWMPHLNDEREKGLKEIQEVINNGRYCATEAASSYLLMLYNEKKYMDVVNYADSILSEYPNYLYCYRYKAKSYKKMNKVKETIETLRWLEDFFDKEPYATATVKSENYYHLAQAFLSKGDKVRAKKYAQKGMKLLPIEGDKKDLFEKFKKKLY